MLEPTVLPSKGPVRRGDGSVKEGSLPVQREKEGGNQALSPSKVGREFQGLIQTLRETRTASHDTLNI